MVAKLTIVSVAVKQAVARAQRIVSTYGKMQGVVDGIMTEQYPTKKAYMTMTWDEHAAFLRALRTADNKSTAAYIHATAWLRDNMGGMRTKDGKSIKDGKHKKGPIAAGVWLRTMSVKLEAAFGYLADAPTKDIEPALLADMADVCAAIERAYAVLEAYRDAEKLAATDEAEATKIAAAQLKLVKAA